MGGVDPHIHVPARGAQGDSEIRNLLAATFGLVGNLPTSITTGCGQHVPYAMTSSRPEAVTCLACREHAHHEHLRRAGEVERLGRAPGATISHDLATLAAQRHRDLARRYIPENG